jgi:hypothetical protein
MPKTKANFNPNGAVLWEGPSLIDGRPVAAVITGLWRNSDNAATGPMLQTWVLRTDVDPNRAVRLGWDKSVCGDCPLRGRKRGEGFDTRRCYVLPHQAPLNIWKQMASGRYQAAGVGQGGEYPRRLVDRVRGRSLRIGSYGDPAAVPWWVWSALVEAQGPGAARTGYTHQWRTCDRRLQQFVMASTESPLDTHRARALGWKTFRVRMPEDQLMPSEFWCPKDRDEDRLTCEECGACRGGMFTGQKTPSTRAHGSAPKMGVFYRMPLSTV